MASVAVESKKAARLERKRAGKRRSLSCVGVYRTCTVNPSDALAGLGTAIGASGAVARLEGAVPGAYSSAQKPSKIPAGGAPAVAGSQLGGLPLMMPMCTRARNESAAGTVMFSSHRLVPCGVPLPKTL